MVTHKQLCPAEYSELSSVHLESAIEPKVIADALERAVIFSAIVSNGDNKGQTFPFFWDVHPG